MEYAIEKSIINERIEREVSRVAASLYSDDGSPLYDAILVTSRDTDIISELIEDAIGEICAKMVDVISREEDKLIFYLPDFDNTLLSTAKNEIDRFIVFFVCSEWLKEKSAADSELYTGRASNALAKAITLLKSRKPPKRK